MNNLLLTGYSGFLGKYIYSFLNGESVQIITIGRQKQNHIIADICKNSFVIDRSYDTIIHSAGKAHSVPKNEIEKQEFFNVNVTGTQNLLKGLEQASLPKAFIFISSVSVYGLVSGNIIPETHPLNAKAPYGQSKIQAEQIIQEWCAKNDVICTILRLPLLVGENPPGNLGTMIKGIRKGYYFNIAGGLAKKSMVLAEDVARFILPASEVGGVYNLTDGYHPSFKELSSCISKQLNKKEPLNIPVWLAGSVARIGDLIGGKFPLNSNKLAKITADLTFDDTKARRELGWNPRPVLEGFRMR